MTTQKNPNEKSIYPYRLHVIGFFAVLVALFILGPIISCLLTSNESRPPKIRLSNSTKKRIQPHLDWADQESNRIIDEHLAERNRFFVDAKANSPAFAKKALDWRSKWLLLVDKVPFTNGKRNETYLQNQFAQHIFSASQLEEVVKQVVDSYIHEVESIESQMLVRIQADMGDILANNPNFCLKTDQLKEKFDEIIALSTKAPQDDIQREVISLIVGEVLVQVGIRLGVSCGILSVGAASSWATMGAGAVAALIVDYAVGWIWNWYANPVSELSGKINAKLEEIRILIVDGNLTGQFKVNGLRRELQKYARERSTVRMQSVYTLAQ